MAISTLAGRSAPGLDLVMSKGDRTLDHMVLYFVGGRKVRDYRYYSKKDDF